MSQLRVTLVKSPIGFERNQRAMAESLGLRKINSSNVLPDNAATRGTIRKIRHLVTVEEVVE